VHESVFACGSDAQRKAYVPKLASGAWIGAWSLTEPTAGSDAGGTKDEGRPAPGGGWILNGSKRSRPTASVGDLTIVFAVTDPALEEEGDLGIRDRDRDARLPAREKKKTRWVFGHRTPPK